MLATFEIMTPNEFENHIQAVARGRFGPADDFPFNTRVEDAVYEVWEARGTSTKKLGMAVDRARRIYAEFYANPPAPFVRRAGT